MKPFYVLVLSVYLPLAAGAQAVPADPVPAPLIAAEVDLKAGKMSSQQPVSIKTNDGSIVAQSIDIADNGKTITFSGQVRARIAASNIKNEAK